LVSFLRKISYQDIITFNDISFFRDYKVYNETYDFGGILLHEKAKNKMMQVSEEQLKDAVASCLEIIKCLRQNVCASNSELSQEMSEYYLAARGVALIQKLALVIKQREYGQEVHPVDTPYELATKLECWLMDYCKDWRAVSLESELYLIKEFVWQICSILRKYDEKSI